MIALAEARRLVERCVQELAVPRVVREQEREFGAHTIDEFGSISISPLSREPCGDYGGPLVDGEWTAADSQEVFAILLLTNGVLSELQIYSGDSFGIRAEVHASNFALFPGMVLAHLARTGEIPLMPPS